jgi:hypothetical protein
MSRTFRKDERTGHRPEDTRRNKRREKANSHYSDSEMDYPFRNQLGRDMKRFYEDDLDTDSD